MKKKILLLSTFFYFTMLWQSCGFSDSIVLNPSLQYEKSSPSEVILYLTKADLPTTYEKIGVVFVGGFPESYIKKARADAAKMGANGLYWEGFDNTANRNSYNINGDTIVVNNNNSNNPSRLIAIRTKE